jgi:hypothetical protein
MVLRAIAKRLKRWSKDDFKGRHFEASLILQAVSWDLRFALSCRDIEELFRERGLAVDHATLNHWVLAYVPLIERRVRSSRKPHCGSVRIDGAMSEGWDGLKGRRRRTRHVGLSVFFTERRLKSLCSY